MENSSDLPSVLWHVRLSQAPHQHTAGWLLGRSVMLQGQEDLQSREGQPAVWLAEGSPRNNSSSFQFIFVHLFFSTLQLHCLLFNLVIYLKNKKNMFMWSCFTIEILDTRHSLSSGWLSQKWGNWSTITVPNPLSSGYPGENSVVLMRWLLLGGAWQDTARLAPWQQQDRAWEHPKPQGTPAQVPGNSHGSESSHWLNGQSPPPKASNSSQSMIEKIWGFFSLLLCSPPSPCPNNLLLFLTPLAPGILDSLPLSCKQGLLQ